MDLFAADQARPREDHVAWHSISWPVIDLLLQKSLHCINLSGVADLLSNCHRIKLSSASFTVTESMSACEKLKSKPFHHELNFIQKFLTINSFPGYTLYGSVSHCSRSKAGSREI